MVNETIDDVKTGILLTMEALSKQRLKLAEVQERLIEALEILEGPSASARGGATTAAEVPPPSEPSERAAREVRKVSPRQPKGAHWYMIRERLRMQQAVDDGWMTAAELAEDLGTSQTAVRSQLYRHNKQLKRERVKGRAARAYVYQLRS